MGPSQEPPFLPRRLFFCVCASLLDERIEAKQYALPTRDHLGLATDW